MKTIILSSALLLSSTLPVEPVVKTPLEMVCIGAYTVTAYRSVKNQTDNSPFITSIGEHVSPDGVAISQDWLKSEQIKYGDWLYIEGVGLKRVNDCMAKRWKHRFDVWVPNKASEAAHHKSHKFNKLKVWKVRRMK